MQIVETRAFKNRTVHVVPDDDPLSPRDMDNLGTILYTSSRYTLGDKQVSSDEIDAITKDEGMIWLPVYAYIHSGIVLSTSSFSDRFDSGMCGIIYCSRESALAEYESEELVKEVLKLEVHVFGKFVSGETYGYIVEDEDGIQIDSSYGYFGVEEAIEVAVSEHGLETFTEAEKALVKSTETSSGDKIYIGTLFRNNREPLDLYASDSGFLWFNGDDYTQTTGRKVKALQTKYGFEYRSQPEY